MREKTLFIQSSPFVEMIITLQKNISKVLDRKSKKLMRLVLLTTDEQNGRLEIILDEDLKIN